MAFGGLIRNSNDIVVIDGSNINFTVVAQGTVTSSLWDASLGPYDRLFVRNVTTTAYLTSAPFYAHGVLPLYGDYYGAAATIEYVVLRPATTVDEVLPDTHGLRVFNESAELVFSTKADIGIVNSIINIDGNYPNQTIGLAAPKPGKKFYFEINQADNLEFYGNGVGAGNYRNLCLRFADDVTLVSHMWNFFDLDAPFGTQTINKHVRPILILEH